MRKYGNPVVANDSDMEHDVGSISEANGFVVALTENA